MKEIADSVSCNYCWLSIQHNNKRTHKMHTNAWVGCLDATKVVSTNDPFFVYEYAIAMAPKCPHTHNRPSQLSINIILLCRLFMLVCMYVSAVCANVCGNY